MHFSEFSVACRTDYITDWFYRLPDTAIKTMSNITSAKPYKPSGIFCRGSLRIIVFGLYGPYPIINTCSYLDCLKQLNLLSNLAYSFIFILNKIAFDLITLVN